MTKLLNLQLYFHVGNAYYSIPQFPRKKNMCVHVYSVFVTLWALASQASLSMEFSRQEYWDGLPFPTLEDLSDPRIKAMSPALAGGFFTTELFGKPQKMELHTLHQLEIKPWSPA